MVAALALESEEEHLVTTDERDGQLKRAMHRLGGYKHIEDEDNEAIKLFAKSQKMFDEVLGIKAADLEAQRTQAKARSYAWRLKIDWGMALESLGHLDSALARYQEGVQMGCTREWVKTENIPRCLAAIRERGGSFGTSNPGPSAEAGEVQFMGESTLEERDAEKRAIDCTGNADEEPPRKRSRAASDLEARVATARSTCDADIKKRFRELMPPSHDEYDHHKIDSAELDKREKAARGQAARADEPPCKLDRAYAGSTAAQAAPAAALAPRAGRGGEAAGGAGVRGGLDRQHQRGRRRGPPLPDVRLSARHGMLPRILQYTSKLLPPRMAHTSLLRTCRRCARECYFARDA